LTHKIILLNWFGAPKIALTQIKEISAGSPEIIVWAAPVMFFFVILEWYFSHKQQDNIYQKAETFASVLIGIGNVLIAFIIKFALFFLVVVVYNWVPWRMHLNWWTIIPCYVILDFCSYWAHRISHVQRFWWATHVVHHSGENYNLSVSFRLSWLQHLKIIFLLPVALLGFHPVIFFVVNQVAVLFQFWVHTEYIGRLHPAVEYIFATPSHHRVHHGSQKHYINKNYAATFIIWDRLFGTFEPEVEKVKYGTTKTLQNKSNPFIINFQEFADIWKDIRSAKTWSLKWHYLFGDPSEIAATKAKAAQCTSGANQKIILSKSRSIMSNEQGVNLVHSEYEHIKST